VTINNDTEVMLTCQAVLMVTRTEAPRIPRWYPGEEAKPAPMPLLLVQAFLNTLDLEKDSDLLGDPRSATAWLVSAGLLEPDSRLSAGDSTLARTARQGIRDLVHAHSDGAPALVDLGPLRAVADVRRPRLVVGPDGAMTLESPRGERIEDALFSLLLVILRAQEEGTWSRLKVCANPECGWAYYDRSRNQQGSWCDMATCGNRLKNRQLRARRA
jgi:predicted RNA-binding Zn ribbon-like protein